MEKAPGTVGRGLVTSDISVDQRLRPLLFPPEDLVELLLEVLLPLLDLEGLLDLDGLLELDERLERVSFLAPLSRDELFLVLLLLDLPLPSLDFLLFSESFVERAEVLERSELFLREELFLSIESFLPDEEGLLLPVVPCLVFLCELRSRTRFSSSEPVLVLLVSLSFADFSLKFLKILLVSPLASPYVEVRLFALVELLFVWLVDLALRVAP
jgi:hypothetical protein